MMMIRCSTESGQVRDTKNAPVVFLKSPTEGRSIFPAEAVGMLTLGFGCAVAWVARMVNGSEGEDADSLEMIKVRADMTLALLFV